MRNRYDILDYLRGIAALLVVLCHLRHTLPQELCDIVIHGKLAVYGFFVISGFIIPYSMARSSYSLRHWHTFWIKRLIRLHPAFVAAILVTFLLSLITGIYKGEAAEFTSGNLLKSLFYLYVPDENPVVWTLLVELKYYLVISLAFPLLFSSRRAYRMIAFSVATICSALLAKHVPDIQFLSLFLIGFAVCYRALGLASTKEATALALIVVSSTLAVSGWAPLAAGLLTAVLIGWNPQIKAKALGALGSISYALYLFHYPIAVKFTNLVMPKISPALNPLIFFAALLISLISGYVFYKLIEAPSSHWSQSIKYKKQPPAEGEAITGHANATPASS